MFPEYKQTSNDELELILQLYDENMNSPIQTTSPSLYVSGSMMMLVFLLFCNSRELPEVDINEFGKILVQRTENGFLISENAQKNMMASILASSVGGLILMFLRSKFFSFEIGQKFGCFYVSNAMLSGVIAVSCCLSDVSVFEATILALFGSILYFLMSKAYLKLEIDDPQESSIVYGVMGLFSTIMVGLLDKNHGLIKTANGKQLAIQIGGAVAIIAFSAILAFFLVLLMKTHRRFKFGQIFEIVGLNSLINNQEYQILSNSLFAKIEQKQRN